MSVTITTTVGGASSNSYVSKSEADLYFASRLDTEDWDGATATDQKEKALVTACQRLEEDSYLGFRCTSTQSLSWPRYGVQKVDEYEGIQYLSTDIPQQLKDAQCELAQELIADSSAITGEADSVESVKIGGIMVSFKAGSTGTISARVSKLLRELRRGASGVPMVRA